MIMQRIKQKIPKYLKKIILKYFEMYLEKHEKDIKRIENIPEQNQSVNLLQINLYESIEKLLYLMKIGNSLAFKILNEMF